MCDPEGNKFKQQKINPWNVCQREMKLRSCERVLSQKDRERHVPFFDFVIFFIEPFYLRYNVANGTKMSVPINSSGDVRFSMRVRNIPDCVRLSERDDNRQKIPMSRYRYYRFEKEIGLCVIRTRER